MEETQKALYKEGYLLGCYYSGIVKSLKDNCSMGEDNITNIIIHLIAGEASKGLEQSEEKTPLIGFHTVTNELEEEYLDEELNDE